ncbi:NADPH-dependent FMN reductase [Sphingoaurantiacus capsulatus]|uniref:NADPH-dependent FMN reductase n=1 Tax=Sphingoaurantiacus capsulatus TaxID=1771310 RepID=A0ABV7XC95_9SPHN
MASADSAISIVAIGGTTRPNSSTEKALRQVLAAAERLGARTTLFSGADLALPMYEPGISDRCPLTSRLIEALRTADGVIIGSPGYHGGVSGLVKNVLDYTEDLRSDTRCYLDGRAVGCIGTGAGWQGAAAALTGLRTIVHALRGWNTPIGMTINTIEPVFDDAGSWRDPKLADQAALMAAQVVRFAQQGRALAAEREAAAA